MYRIGDISEVQKRNERADTVSIQVVRGVEPEHDAGDVVLRALLRR
jgi:hypothetical protein